MHRNPRALRNRKGEIAELVAVKQRQARVRAAKAAFVADCTAHVMAYVDEYPDRHMHLRHAPYRSLECATYQHASTTALHRNILGDHAQRIAARSKGPGTARKAQHNPDPLPCDHPHFNQEAHNMVTAIGWFVTALCGIFFLISLFK